MSKNIFFELKYLHYILLSLLLIFGFLLTFGIHYNQNIPFIGVEPGTKPSFSPFPLPIHNDEWAHIGQAEYLITEGKISNVNPYIQSLYHVNLEEGFVAFLAVFFSTSGLDPVLSYQYLPAIFMILTMLSLWYFMYKITGKYSIAHLSAAFLLLIKSNMLTLGFWFLTPLTFSLFFIIIFFLAMKIKDKNNLFNLFLFVIALFAYPLAALIIGGVLILQFLILDFDNKKLVKKILRKSVIFVKRYKFLFIGILFALIVATWIVLGGNIHNFPILYSYDWTGFFVHVFFPWELIGLLPFALSLLGMISVWEDKFLRKFLIIPFTMLIESALYIFFRVTIFVDYPRSIFFLTLSLVPLAALGTYKLYKLTLKILEKIHFTRKNSIIKISTFVIISFIFIVVFFIGLKSFYSVPNQKYSLQYYVEIEDYIALSWVGENYPKNTLMLINSLTALGSYPIAHTQSIAIAESNVGAGDVSEVIGFYSSNSCDEKYSYLQKFRPVLVYTITPIDCNFLKLVYSKKAHIYEVIY